MNPQTIRAFNPRSRLGRTLERLIDIAALPEDELVALHTHYRSLVQTATRDVDLLEPHSVEEARQRHRKKALSPS